MEGDDILEGGGETVLLLLLLMTTNWLVGGKGSARNGRGLSIRGWPRISPTPSPSYGY